MYDGGDAPGTSTKAELVLRTLVECWRIPSVQWTTTSVLVFVRLITSDPSTGRRTVTVNEQEAVLLQASRATSVTVLVVFGRKNVPDGGDDVTVTLVQASVAFEGQKTCTLLLQVVTVMLDGHTMVGGFVSTTETNCVQRSDRLVQQSVACQMPRHIVRHGPTTVALVLVSRIVRFVPQQLSVAVGGSKTQLVPHSTVLFVAQVIIGGVVSFTVTYCVQ